MAYYRMATTYGCIPIQGLTDVGEMALTVVLKIYSARDVYYRFSVLAVNIETQP